MPQHKLQRVVIGHRSAVGFIERVLTEERPSHAYLFHGPARVGKTTLALAFAQALNCGAAERPCGQCRQCRIIADGHHPDVRVLGIQRGDETGPAQDGRKGRKNTRLISIEQVRALQHDATLAPYEARWKVYIVVGAESLSVDAMNCLLKTLEEPPAQVLLALTTVDSTLLLPTIVSRCQQIRLGTVGVAELATGLRERFGVESARADLLSHLAGGRVGWAIDALEDAKILEERSGDLADLVSLGQGRIGDRFAYAEKMAQEFGRDPERVSGVLHLWLAWWRDVLLVRSQCLDYVSNRDSQDELRRQAERFSVRQIHGFLRAIQGTLDQLAQNVNPRLALEVLLIDMPSG